jgi:alkylhydroperoxidase family enzyme
VNQTVARIPPLEYEDADPAMQAEYDRVTSAQGRMTNMKRTLAHSPAALRALLEWYPLNSEVREFLGERATLIFVHAISSETDCLICSTFFRRILIESGEDPAKLVLDDREQTLVDFGRQLVTDSNAVSDELFARLAAFLSPKQIVVLTAFGGIMIGTNVFNNALRVDLDEYLWPFQAGGRASASSTRT